MGNKVIFITGSNGEMGRYLIEALNKAGSKNIIALDLEQKNNILNTKFIQGSILDTQLLDDINEKYEISEIYHLAAILSTKAENNPQLANDVNINGTKNIFELGQKQAIKQKKNILFFFPSSIAVYNLEENNNSKINEEDYCSNPLTEYGKAKLICEDIGERLDTTKTTFGIDFRAIRFPGIISATTLPTGGTSDYAPEMIHAAAQNKSYKCFVMNNRKLPFIVMPDAIDAIFKIMKISKKKLLKSAYNITSFSPSVEEFYNKTKEYFQNFNMTYSIDSKRQKIIDSWPNYVNDSAAQNDWGWKSKYNFSESYSNYIIPQIKIKYNMEKYNE